MAGIITILTQQMLVRESMYRMVVDLAYQQALAQSDHLLVYKVTAMGLMLTQMLVSETQT